MGMTNSDWKEAYNVVCDDRDAMRSAHGKAVDRIRELEAELVEARLDSARLDGLQKHHQHVNLAGLPVVECLGLVYHKNEDEWSCGNNVLGGWFRKKTLRAAIDAAMKEAK